MKMIHLLNIFESLEKLLSAEQFQQTPLFKRHYGQYGKLSALSQVLIFLWYLGHQTASCLNRVIKRVVVFLSNLSAQIITWPTEDQKRDSEAHLRERGFPGVIGAIDGCHIKIDKPKYDPDSYINRKGFHSVQLIQFAAEHRRELGTATRAVEQAEVNVKWMARSYKPIIEWLTNSTETITS